ncbi:MAG: cobaltochelatase subunit CobN, partial [Actinomycetota bacterium]
MILFLTTADTEILAASRARELLPEGFPGLRCANPAGIGDPRPLLEGAHAVVVRLLGGRGAWREGFDLLAAGCAESGVPLLAFGGEAAPDAELAAASTAPAGMVAEAFEYLRQGGVENFAHLFRFLADSLLNEGFGFEPPAILPDAGVYRPEALDGHRPGRPTVGIVFYRTHWASGNTGFVDVLAQAVADAGGNPLPVFCYTLRPGADGGVPALDLLDGKVDALIVTVLASGGAAGDGDWHAPSLEALGVPVVQGICATAGRAAWAGSSPGLSPLDAAMQVAIPEFDGRIVGVSFSFKEPLSGEPGSPMVYRADPERARRLAGIAVRLARLRGIQNENKRVGIILSNYPTKHSRVGNAVGLDTPASALRLLRAMAGRGYRVEGLPEESDALIHALIAAGGQDAEFLTESQMRSAEARLEAHRYREWFEELPG